MAWPEDSLSDDETIVTSFRPHWVTLFVPTLWFLGLSVAFVAVVANFANLTWVVSIALAVFLVLFVVRPLVGWWYTRYVLTNERLITRAGLVAQSGVEIPLERITNVNFAQSAIERLVGAGDLLIESAGSAGQSEFEDIPHPDEFQTLLYKTREARTVELSGPPAAPQPGTGAAEAMRQLTMMRDEGHISAEEYEQKRKLILDEM